MKYIDISEHQGLVDWEAVRGSVDGVILRAGFGKGSADARFARNAAECNRLGIPMGAYWFSYAASEDKINKGMDILSDVIRKIKGGRL